MSLRSLSKGRLLLSILLFTSFVWIAYLYLNSLQGNHNISESGNRCMSELTSIKYQLNVVTEYKNRIDRLLTETQKAREADKERYKDVIESCGAMKQHITICQLLPFDNIQWRVTRIVNKQALTDRLDTLALRRDSQFEDLQSECKIVKEDYDKLKKDAEKLKTS